MLLQRFLNELKISPFAHIFPYKQFVIFDDTEEFGPLAKALFAQQKCTDASVLHQIHGRLLRWPLVTHLLALPILLFFVI